MVRAADGEFYVATETLTHGGLRIYRGRRVAQ
jgi:hypothetical protein